MKLCKIIEYNKGNMILQNYAENESETTVVYSNHYGIDFSIDFCIIIMIKSDVSYIRFNLFQ